MVVAGTAWRTAGRLRSNRKCGRDGITVVRARVRLSGGWRYGYRDAVADARMRAGVAARVRSVAISRKRSTEEAKE